MKSSQSSSEPTAANKPSPHCAFSGCKVPPTKTCSRWKETRYCSKEHQTAHWKWDKKICVAPQKKISASASPLDLIFDDAYIMSLVGKKAFVRLPPPSLPHLPFLSNHLRAVVILAALSPPPSAAPAVKTCATAPLTTEALDALRGINNDEIDGVAAGLSDLRNI